MSTTRSELVQELDGEWVQLMVQAKELGYSTNEVRTILAAIQEGLVEEIREMYA